MGSGFIAGLFSTTVGGVPKPRVDTLDVTTNGIRHEIIRDKKHHGGTEKAVCLMSVETMEHLQSLGNPIHGGSTGENILMDVPQASLGVGVQLTFNQVKLEITMAAPPCKTIADSFSGGDFNQLSNKKYPGQTRWYARVLQEGFIHEEEQVSINSNA